MQRERGREESINSGGSFDSFGSFRGFGPQRSVMSSIFGGRDPFDDPFFTRPFGNIFGSSMFSSERPVRESPHISSLKEPVIEELHTDDEEEEKVADTDAKGKKYTAGKYTVSNEHPHVEHPDEETDVVCLAGNKNKDVAYRTRSMDQKKVKGMNSQSRGASFQKVTYGGINGAYYTASTTRRTGNDGVVLEECKEADTTTGQATHRISRGLHDKGHSVTRKLNSDGVVDTMQMLHNLNEDELTGFEQAWKGNAVSQFPGQDDGVIFNGTAGPRGWGSGSRLAFPFEGFSRRAGGTGATFDEPRISSSGRRPKKVVTINIE